MARFIVARALAFWKLDGHQPSSALEEREMEFSLGLRKRAEGRVPSSELKSATTCTTVRDSTGREPEIVLLLSTMLCSCVRLAHSVGIVPESWLTRTWARTQSDKN